MNVVFYCAINIVHYKARSFRWTLQATQCGTQTVENEVYDSYFDLAELLCPGRMRRLGTSDDSFIWQHIYKIGQFKNKTFICYSSVPG